MSAVPVQKPIIVTRPKPELRVEQGTRSSVTSSVLARAVLFSVVTLAIFLASSLAGQVMVEKARRDGMKAISRAKDATKEETLLRDRVQSITQSSAIDAWAQMNGFVAPETLVAQVEPADSASEKDANAQAIH